MDSQQDQYGRRPGEIKVFTLSNDSDISFHHKFRFRKQYDTVEVDNESRNPAIV